MSTPSHPSPEQDELDKIITELMLNCIDDSNVTERNLCHFTNYGMDFRDAIAAIRTWALKVSLECVGEDDISGGNPGHTFWEQHRNRLRAELRTKLIEAFKQEEKQ